MKTAVRFFVLFATLSLAVACSSSDETEHAAAGNGAGGNASHDAAVDTSPPQDSGKGDVAADTGNEDAGQDSSADSGPDDGGTDSSPDSGKPDAPKPWPTCDSRPSGMTPSALPQIWSSAPSKPTAVWVEGVWVTAISKGGCSAGKACQIFLQDALSFPTFDEGAHHAIKLFVSARTAHHFSGLKVGDQVQVLAHAWRYNLHPPQNELLLQVNAALPGCAFVTGQGSPTPIPHVPLDRLTVDAYENSHGPLLISVEEVSGKPGAPTETFAIWKTHGPFRDAGPQSVVSASPYFLPGGAFSGLPTDGQTKVDFDSISGVFGLFVPYQDAGAASKYLMLYPRGMNEMPHQ